MDSPSSTIRTSRFWRIGLTMCLIVIGGLSLLPYLMSTGAEGEIPEAPFHDSRFMSVEDTRLHYRDLRPEGVEAPRGQILLVHGLAGSTYSWRKVAEPLASVGYRVVSVDLPPFGYSEARVPGDDAASAETLLWGLLEALDQGGGWHLLGHSMGAGVVARMAVDAPESVRALVMVSGTPDTAAEGGRGIGGLVMRYPPVRRWLTVIGSGRLLNPEGMGRALSSAYGRDATAEEIDAYLAPLLTSGKPDAVIRFLHQGQEVVEPEQLQGLPLTVIWGGHDEWVPLSNGRRLADAADAPLQLIDEAAHNPMETHPEAFLDALERPLQGQ
ncbi:pimeloyl-ACP methyl ester carboxylesterase [Natronospira proteinivora]|uniref:Pimeloyl-ACP methyl ester carboxylesterase n=1 Tax=Natronospira proteinivora TaxID=1807133 RepID=A0ABT1GCM3_9GAMM|nr:alpha/beta hydrolase [Natronospira proteinivora]MCP1727687.1 pimeloyl-ACP methyl ester carboxylesterase [Natronospira proteinivora]